MPPSSPENIRIQLFECLMTPSCYGSTAWWFCYIMVKIFFQHLLLPRKPDTILDGFIDPYILWLAQSCASTRYVLHLYSQRLYCLPHCLLKVTFVQIKEQQRDNVCGGSIRPRLDYLLHPFQATVLIHPCLGLACIETLFWVLVFFVCELFDNPSILLPLNTM